QGEADEIELLARGRKQEIALVAIGIGGTMQRARSGGQAARGNVMAGRKRLRAKLARGDEQIAELDRAVALDARHRGLARGVALGKGVDHRLLEALLVIEHVMRNADPFCDVARAMDVLAGA